jgi:hypothetical protein
MFAVRFDEIAPIVGRSPAATRQLASRGRLRVQGSPAMPDTDLNRQREVVGAFLAASRGGDFEALLSMLDPEVVFRADAAAVAMGALAEARSRPDPTTRRHPGNSCAMCSRYALLFSSRAKEARRGADVAQLVERNLAKVEVAGSNPVVRSEEVSRLELCGGVAERRGNGLQSRLHGFESRLHLEIPSGLGRLAQR